MSAPPSPTCPSAFGVLVALVLGAACGGTSTQLDHAAQAQRAEPADTATPAQTTAEGFAEIGPDIARPSSDSAVVSESDPAVTGMALPEAQAANVEVEMLGAWGCSLVTNEWRAFDRHPAPFGTWTGFNWGGRSLDNWHRALDRPFGGHWADFQAVADRHPETTDLYAEICLKEASLPASTYEAMAETVFVEMRRRLGPEVRIWASAMASADSRRCQRRMRPAAQVAAHLVDHVVALGLAERGPRLSPLQPWEIEGFEGGCHPNDAGEDRAAAQIVEFFTHEAR